MFYLKTSDDFGVRYTIECFNIDKEFLKNKAYKIEQEKNKRWVITDVDDKPLYWSVYLEANLRTPISNPIATDDPYVKKLAEKQGRRVYSTKDFLISFLGFTTDEADKRINDTNKAPSKSAVKTTLENMRTLIKEGIAEVLPTNIKEDEIGKKLFGEETVDEYTIT